MPELFNHHVILASEKEAPEEAVNELSVEWLLGVLFSLSCSNERVLATLTEMATGR